MKNLKLKILFTNSLRQISCEPLKVIDNTFKELFELKGTYASYDKAENTLNELYSEIQITLEAFEYELSVNEVEEPVESESD